jgi:transposase
LEALLYPSVERDLLKTIPCVGKILSAVIALEVGDVRRFPSTGDLVSYAGLVPSARESAERKRQGGCPRDCNVYLKWAFVEAGNLIACKQKYWPEQHAVQLYRRVKQSTKMHGKATMAVGRHLAEASYWILSKQEAYREPKPTRQVLSSTHG